MSENRKYFGRPLDTAKSEAILEAAISAFGRNGFDGSSIEAIAKDAGVSKVTVYSRFDDKESLFLAAVEHSCEELSNVLIETDTATPIARRLRSFGLQMQSLVFHPDFAQIERRIAAESGRDPNVGEAFLDAGPRRIRSLLVRVLEDGRERSELEIEDAKLAAEQFGAMVKGFADVEFRFGCQPNPVENRKRVDAAVDLFMRAYGKQTS